MRADCSKVGSKVAPMCTSQSRLLPLAARGRLLSLAAAAVASSWRLQPHAALADAPATVKMEGLRGSGTRAPSAGSSWVPPLLNGYI